MHMWMDDLCSEDGQRVYDKKLLCIVTVAKRSFSGDANFCLNKLTKLTAQEPQQPYMATHNCLWCLGCQIVSLLPFLTGDSAKLKPGHVKRYAVALSVYGASRLRICPGSRIHSIRPYLHSIFLPVFFISACFLFAPCVQA